MPQYFEHGTCSFAYPDNWTIEESSSGDDDFTVIVTSPKTAFLSITFPGVAFQGMGQNTEDLHELTQSALKSITEEFDDVEPQPLKTLFAGCPAEGYDVYFCYSHFVIHAHILAIELYGAPVLFVMQAVDLEFEKMRMVFEAIATSLVQQTGKKASECE